MLCCSTRKKLQLQLNYDLPSEAIALSWGSGKGGLDHILSGSVSDTVCL